MKDALYIIFIVIAYVIFVLASLAWLLGPIEDVFEERYPKLIEGRWKRILWLLSCLLFIPFPASLLWLYSIIADDVKRFISRGTDEEDRNENGSCL